MESKHLFYIILTVIFISILFIIFYQYQSKQNNKSIKNKKKESFSNQVGQTYQSLSNSVNDFIRQNGFDSIQTLTDFVKGHYNEDFQNIMEQNTLTLYFSTFSSDSIPQLQNKLWKNISPYFKDVINSNCKLLSYDQSHFDFDEIPYANTHVGIEMLSNKAYGPPSHLMGIQGNGTFSIFTVIKFNGFSNLNKVQNIFKIYGNTMGNNAITLSIEGLIETKESKIIRVIPKLYYGDNPEILINNNNGESSFSLDMDKKYLIILTKKHRNISLSINDLSTETIQNSNHKIINEVEVNESNVLFSNKEMTLNENENLNANMYAFGIYNMHLLDETALHKYMYNELYKSTENFMREAKHILQFQNELNSLRSCPYDEKVCQECQINDWTDMDKILHSSESCKKEIDKFCTHNPTHAKCKCWRPEYKDTSQCRSYVNIFKNEKWANVDHMDKSMIQAIQEKYKLCDCEETDKLKEKLSSKEKELDTCQQQKQIQPPDMLVSPYLNQPSSLPSSLPSPSPLPSSLSPPLNTSYENSFDPSFQQPNLDPTYNTENLNIDDNLKIDPRYGEEMETSPKGFWAWLFGQ